MPNSDFANEDVEALLRVIEGLSNVEILYESGDVKLHVRKFSAGSPPISLAAPGPGTKE